METEQYFLGNTAGNPEQTRQYYVARSGSQSQLRIPLILPKHGASHIINNIIIHSKYFPVSDWLKPHA